MTDAFNILEQVLQYCVLICMYMYEIYYCEYSVYTCATSRSVHIDL